MASLQKNDNLAVFDFRNVHQIVETIQRSIAASETAILANTKRRRVDSQSVAEIATKPASVKPQLPFVRAKVTAIGTQVTESELEPATELTIATEACELKKKCKGISKRLFKCYKKAGHTLNQLSRRGNVDENLEAEYQRRLDKLIEANKKLQELVDLLAEIAEDKEGETVLVAAVNAE